MNEYIVQIKIKANSFKEAVNKVPEDLGEVLGGAGIPRGAINQIPKASAPSLGQ